MKATNAELISLLSYLFEKHHLLFESLTPEGWVNSPLILFLHPTPEQRFQESFKLYERLNRLEDTSRDKVDREPPRLEDFLPEDLSGIHPIGEFRYLLAIAVYEIFSNNHQVLDESLKEYDMGSLRGSGRFLSEFLNMFYPEGIKVYDYMDFYYTFPFIAHRSDLSPLFEFIFEKLKKRGMEWIYSVPEMSIIDWDTESSPNNFDPHRDLLEKQFNELLIQRMENALEDINMAMRKKILSETPSIVKAYFAIYDKYPSGWPG